MFDYRLLCCHSGLGCLLGRHQSNQGSLRSSDVMLLLFLSVASAHIVQSELICRVVRVMLTVGRSALCCHIVASDFC